jgi:hypothetical protein
VKRLLAAVLIGLLVAPPAFAATCTFSGDGVYSAGGSCAANPGTADTCVLNAGVEVTCDVATCDCGSWTVNGGLIVPQGRTLSTGSATNSGTTDGTIVIASTGFLVGDDAPHLEFNCDRAADDANANARCSLTNSGSWSWNGKPPILSGTVSSVVASGTYPDRLFTITDLGIQQPVNNFYSGKYLRMTSGYWRHATWPITNTGATPFEVAVRLDDRGALDTRNVTGRVDVTTPTPGDEAEIVSRANGDASGAIISGTSLTFTAGIFADASEATAILLGSRFISADDLNVASDPDYRRVCAVASATAATLCSAYSGTGGTSGANDGFRVLDDNQPPRALIINKAIRPGDTYEIFEPATIGLTAGRGSDTHSDHQYNLILQDGSTTSLRNILIDRCGYDSTGGVENQVSCIRVNSIDNSLSSEQFTAERFSMFHLSGEAGLYLHDAKNITVQDFEMNVAAAGGQVDGHQVHGVIVSRASVIPQNVHIRRGRITRLNDTLYGITGAGASNLNCQGCSGEDLFLGYTPNLRGGSVNAIAITDAVSEFLAKDILTIQAPGFLHQSSNLTPSPINSASFNRTLQLNTPAAQTAIMGSYVSGAIADALNQVTFAGSAVVASVGGTHRGDVIDSFIAPLNALPDLLVAPIFSPQSVAGAVILQPPNGPISSGSIFHEPTSSGLSLLSQNPLPVVDVVGFANYTQQAVSHTTLGHFDADSGGATTTYAIDHATAVCNDRQAGTTSAYGINVATTAGTSTITNGIWIDCEIGLRDSGGAGTVDASNNLMLGNFINYSGVTDVTGNLTTGTVSLGQASTGDATVGRGSTPWSSPASDDCTVAGVTFDCPRGARVAGPPNPERFLALYPWPLIWDSTGAAYPTTGEIVSIVNTNTIGDVDTDQDGIWDLHDNCDRNPNPHQIDGDADGIGCECDTAGDTCP